MTDGSNEKKPPASGEAREDRGKSRRRRRGRRSGERPPQADAPSGGQEPKSTRDPREPREQPREQPREAREQPREQPREPREQPREQPREARESQEGKGKSRGRRRNKGRKPDGPPREEPGKGTKPSTQRAPSERGASPERSPTIPPPPRLDAAGAPAASESADGRNRDRRNRRTTREEAPRKPRAARPEKPKAEKPQSVRWSQAPAPDFPPEPTAPPPPVARPREPGPPVFLVQAGPEPPLDPDTAIDVKPWEASIAEGPGDGTLYNTIVVRGHRSQRARIYDAGDTLYDRGEVVAIEGDAGSPGTGVVVQPNRRELFRGRLPRVIRRLHPTEVSAEPRGKRREQEVFRIARHVATTLDLPIKVIRAQAEQSGKIVVFFACEERIDFRELYRRVSAAAQGRIELRQVGVRDAAKMLGGVAPCGLQLCCTSFLKDFAPVSIKMAKEQGLVLNPQRVSGLCGRLLCCLTYEDELYRTQRKLLPKLGKRVVTPSGPGKVRDVDVLSQTVRVALDNGDVTTVKPSEITAMFPSPSADEREERSDGRSERRGGRGRRPPAEKTEPVEEPLDSLASDDDLPDDLPDDP